MSDYPQKTRVYSSHLFNSERWNNIELRDDDIIISTAMKSGTNWMIRIVGMFVHQDPHRTDAQMMHAPWNYRHLPNILLVHFNDLKVDLEGEMRRIARFLNKEIPEADWPAYVEAATFETMKKDMPTLKPAIEHLSNYGTKGFMHSGKNKRWRDVLTEDDLALYEARASKLDPDLRNWLENGRLATGNVQDW